MAKSKAIDKNTLKKITEVNDMLKKRYSDCSYEIVIGCNWSVEYVVVDGSKKVEVLIEEDDFYYYSAKEIAGVIRGEMA